MKQHPGIRKTVCAGLAVVWLLLAPLWAACAETAGAPDYALGGKLGLFCRRRGAGGRCLFRLPHGIFRIGGNLQHAMDDQEARSSFLGAINMEKGIYDASACFYAPYYRQIGLNVYALPEEEREPWLALAYEDVKAALTYYLENCNDGRPLVLAGFSQGPTCASA